MMRSFLFVAALSTFALFASACGDDDWDQEKVDRDLEELLRPASEIRIQRVVVYDTKADGCAWDGLTCKPFIPVGIEPPDPFAVAELIFKDGTKQGPITSNTCQDTTTCNFKGFGFSLPDPLEDSWNSVDALHVKVWDEDGLEDDLIGEMVFYKPQLNEIFTISKKNGFVDVKGTLDTRIVSMRISIQ